MPVIVPCGYESFTSHKIRVHIADLVRDTQYGKSNDLTFIPKDVPALKVMTNHKDPFLLVFASDGWLEKHRDDFLAKLQPHYEVFISRGEYHPRKK